MTDLVLELQGLSKQYGKLRALDTLTLQVQPGPIGLLGPNGAGKSTLLKLLLGLLRPTSGRATIVGLDPARFSSRLALRRLVGYMPESECLIPRMNAVELVATLGRITGMSRADAMTRAHEVLDYVGLEEARYRLLEEYSTGMKQRLKLAQALVHDPGLLLLDEPTNGLDPKGRRDMLELIRDLGQNQGKNILLCSHLLRDVEFTCTEVIVIHRGRVLRTGSIQELTRQEETWIDVEVDQEGEVPAGYLAALEQAGLPTRRDESGLAVQCPEERASELFRIAHSVGLVVTSLRARRSSLEEVFLQTLEAAEQG